MMQGMHLRDLVRALGWSYGALWSMPNVMTELVWVDGSFEANQLRKYDSQYWNVERLFSTSYKSCSFPPGSGYAGKVLAEGQALWLNGTDVLIDHSNSSSQAHFFKVAGIQTLLCIPWFNSVVELGSSSSVPRNSKLLDQIREFFLSHVTTAAATKQQLLTNAFSPIEGPLLSQGFSTGSDDASFSGGVNRDQQLESCSSFPLEGSLPEVSPVSRSARQRSVAARRDLNEEVVAGSGESDWKLDFASSEMLHERLSSSRSPTCTSSLQQQMRHQEEVVEEADFDSSFLVSPRQQMPLFGQLQTISSSHSSSKGDSYNRSSASAGKQQSTSELSRRNSNASNKSSAATTGFAPWNATAQKNSPGRIQYGNSHSNNQVVLQRCLHMMTHKIPQLSASREKQRATEQQTIAAIRRSAAAAAAAEEAAAEVLSGHDEAAVTHMLAERKRRQKQKENFAALRALIPFVSKMDRASILGDAISYVKQLTGRVEELEFLNRELEAQIPYSQRKRSRSSTITSL